MADNLTRPRPLGILMHQALLDMQDKLEIERGAPNLWPGTASTVCAKVARQWMEDWEAYEKAQTNEQG